MYVLLQPFAAGRYVEEFHLRQVIMGGASSTLQDGERWSSRFCWQTLEKVGHHKNEASAYIVIDIDVGIDIDIDIDTRQAYGNVKSSNGLFSLELG